MSTAYTSHVVSAGGTECGSRDSAAGRFELNDAGVGRFVFISTGGAIYGEGDGKELPLGEDAAVEPLQPSNSS